MLNSFKDARKYFLLTQKLKPNCPSIAKHLQELAISERKYKAQENVLYKKMFSCDLRDDCAGASKGNMFRSASKPTTESTTMDQGVIITESDQLADFNENRLKKAVNNMKINDNVEAEHVLEPLSRIPKNLKPEFVDIVLNELDCLVNSKVAEAHFPSNLCADEILFISLTAENYDCHIEFVHRNNSRYPKVVKNSSA